MSYSASRSITQWIILFRNTRRSVCAEIVLRSLAGYRLMGSHKLPAGRHRAA